MKEYIVSQKYIDGIYTDEGSTFGLDMQKELVRCKDCKHFTRDSITGVTIPGTEYCIFTMNNRIEENDFCSRAERKEE